VSEAPGIDPATGIDRRVTYDGQGAPAARDEETSEGTAKPTAE
jgi:hypothetical protein